MYCCWVEYVGWVVLVVLVVIIDVLLLGGISWLGCVGHGNRCTVVGWNKFVELCWLC